VTLFIKAKNILRYPRLCGRLYRGRDGKTRYQQSLLIASIFRDWRIWNAKSRDVSWQCL